MRDSAGACGPGEFEIEYCEDAYRTGLIKVIQLQLRVSLMALPPHRLGGLMNPLARIAVRRSALWDPVHWGCGWTPASQLHDLAELWNVVALLQSLKQLSTDIV